jgi:L-ascorbate metabolism protein UlaG (beta-lactamase superfamily)
MRRPWRICCLLLLVGAATLPSSPAVAEAGLSKSTVKAREAFFGAPNVDRRGKVRRDRVILSWFGVASLAASFDGQVVLLDSFINNYGPDGCWPPPAPPYVRTDYRQLAALKPKAIFIGHQHFDHQCKTAELIASSGAKLVGLPQACEKARQEAAALPGAVRVRCTPTLSAFSGFGASREIRPLGRRIRVTVIRNLHSGLASAPPSNSAGAESVMFRFAVGRFSLLWNNTVGPLREHSPRTLAVLRALPTDVNLGSIKGFGQAEQGLRDPVDYMQAIRAKLFYPIHHDFYALEATPQNGSSIGLRAPLRAEMDARRGLRTKLRWLQDPGDYLRPISFRPTARRYAR